MWPHRPTARSTMRRGASSPVRSTASVATRSGSPTVLSSSASRPSSRPMPTTAMPASASFVAHPKPMPLLAPVTIATCISPILHQRRADLMLEYLARVVLRQGIPDDNPFRGLEFGDALAHQEREQARDVRALRTRGNDHRAGAFSGALVGQPDDRDLGDAGVI